MTGHINLRGSSSYIIANAASCDFRKIVSLYKAVRNQLGKDEKLFVYPPRLGTLERIFHGNGHVLLMKHKPQMDIVAAMVVEYPTAANDNLGLSRKLFAEFENCSVLRSYVTSGGHRGKGLGRSLVAEWIKRSQMDGRPYCVTEVVQGNRASFNLLKDLGFKDIKRAIHPHDRARTHLLILNADQPQMPTPDIFK